MLTETQAKNKVDTITLKDAQKAVDQHRHALTPGWVVSVREKVFDDFDPEPPTAGRAQISYHSQRKTAWLDIDLRTKKAMLQGVICHELAHIAIRDFESVFFRMANHVKNKAAKQELLDILSDENEKLSWFIADLYLTRGKAK